MPVLSNSATSLWPTIPLIFLQNPTLLTNTPISLLHLEFVMFEGVCYETIMIHHTYVTLTPTFCSTTLVLLSQPTSPICPSQSRAVSDPYMTIHIKHCQDLESLPTLREKGHQSYFLTSSYYLLPPHFTSDPSPFHIRPIPISHRTYALFHVSFALHTHLIVPPQSPSRTFQ